MPLRYVRSLRYAPFTVEFFDAALKLAPGRAIRGFIAPLRFATCLRHAATIPHARKACALNFSFPTIQNSFKTVRKLLTTKNHKPAIMAHFRGNGP